MKRLNFSEKDIRDILDQQKQGKTVSQICKEVGISEATYYNWKVKLQGGSSERIRSLEKENSELRNFCMNVILRTNGLQELSRRG